MRILFVMRNEGYVRNYASVIRLLAARGHDVLVGSRGEERHMAVSTAAFVAELHCECPRVDRVLLPRRGDAWADPAARTRAWRNALRYRDPRFRHAPKLTARAMAHLEKRTSAATARRARRIPWPAARVLLRLLDNAESAIPTAPAIDEMLRSVAPDVVVVTPLVDFNSFQIDYVKSARRLGIPVAAGVASWDNLTNKGIVAIQPDRIFVWNDAQAEEAVTLHGVPRDRVVVTGAQLFDEWFDRAPSATREGFCARIGLDPARRLVAYLCSSLFIAPDEPSFVREWLSAIRASPDPSLRDCGIVIRPHPGSANLWSAIDLGEFGRVAIWPRAGEMPLFEAGKASYFDTLYHADAVVGINTSAMIEAAILGRRTLTILAPEFNDTQRGTLHYQHVAPILREAGSLPEHVAHLAEEVSGRHDTTGVRAFVGQFVRPAGIDRPATPILADAIEAASRLRPTAAGTPASAALWRFFLRPRVSAAPARSRRRPAGQPADPVR